MKKINLFDALAHIDPAFIESSAEAMEKGAPPAKRLRWKYILTVAACFILIAALIAVPIAQIPHGDTTTPSTSPADTSSAPPTFPPDGNGIPPQLKGMADNIEDDHVEFLYVEGGNGTYTADSIWVDPDSAYLDSVDNKIIERNNKIKEVLGVDIFSFTNTSLGIGDLLAEAKNYFDNQLDTLDVYCGYQYYDISVATTGNLVNLNTLVNDKGEKLIDIEQSYWATNYIKSITYNDLLYWVTGDLSLRYTGGLYCTFVNTTIYDRAVKSLYDNRTIYEVVDNGDWTMATMLQMAQYGWDDDDDSGTATEGDTYGIVFESCDILDGLAFGCQVDFCQKSGNDITISLQNDSKAKELAGYIADMWAAPSSYNAGNSDSQNMMPIFADGMALFAINKLYMAEVWLGEMPDYAVVPTPKLNKDQTNYASGVHDSLTIFGISKWSNCKNTAAATLELMSYYGSQLVTPTFIDKVLKGTRTTRDEDAQRMVDVIRNGFDSDFVSAWSRNVSDIVQIYRSQNNCKQWDSTVGLSAVRTWPQALSDLLTQLEEASE